MKLGSYIGSGSLNLVLPRITLAKRIIDVGGDLGG
jgi:hypothetical protein